ncbi:MAG: SDR family oxidoreductase [Chloroflexi bacterium]|nr:SDR family oxidoreductase [Chloroflexota bacterium]
MRVLITGCAGFIGSHLADRFLDAGHTVVGMDNLITGTMRNIAHLQGHPRFTFIHHNIVHYISVDGAINAVLHFASPASPIDYLKLPIQTLKVGALGTHNALGLARGKGAKFILASTSEVYGDPLEHPQREEYVGNVDFIGPRGVYDEAKRYAEALTMAYHRSHNLDSRIVRIFNTYGPRMRLDDGRVVPNFIGQALRGEALTIYGDGTQTRSFQYIDDLVEGVVRLLESDYHQPVNIGTTEEMNILEFAQIINELTGNKGGIIFQGERIKGDPQTRQPDITRARTILNWEPKVPLRAGVQRTIEYFRNVI